MYDELMADAKQGDGKWHEEDLAKLADDKTVLHVRGKMDNKDRSVLYISITKNVLWVLYV